MNIGMAYFEFGGMKGVARVAAELTRQMIARGHDVHFYCAELPPNQGETGVNFHRVNAVNSFSTLGLASFAIAAGRGMRRGRHTVTHSHGNIIGADVITAHSCHKAGVRVFAPRDNRGIADLVRLRLEQKNYGEKQFKKVIAVSNGVQRELMHEYNLTSDNIVVIPNGVDCDRFSPSRRNTARTSTRLQLGFSPDDLVMIFVANEFERKGLSFLLDALSLVRHNDVKLLVVGDDKEMPRFARRANDLKVGPRTVFAGSIKNVEDYYAASDAFVFPTFYEAFSLATLEAAAAGLPLLATNVNGTEDLIQDGHNGLFVSRDADDIAAKIRLMVEDQELRKYLGANARITAQQYSWDIITDLTLNVYEEVARR